MQLSPYRLFTPDKTGITLSLANYSVNHFKRDKFIQDQFVVEMYRMADIADNRRKIMHPSFVFHLTISKMVLVKSLLISFPTNVGTLRKKPSATVPYCWSFIEAAPIISKSITLQRILVQQNPMGILGGRGELRMTILFTIPYKNFSMNEDLSPSAK